MGKLTFFVFHSKVISLMVYNSTVNKMHTGYITIVK